MGFQKPATLLGIVRGADVRRRATTDPFLRSHTFREQVSKLTTIFFRFVAGGRFPFKFGLVIVALFRAQRAVRKLCDCYAFYCRDGRGETDVVLN